MIYIIAYDISDSEKRNEAARLLCRYGKRIQYSVFQCELTPIEMRELAVQLRQTTDEKFDSLHIYPVCSCCFELKRIIGSMQPYERSPYMIL